MDNMKKSSAKRLVQTAVVAVFCFGSLAVNVADAGVSGDAYWIVEKGDSVYSIARKVFPDDKNKQRQFRKELVDNNAAVFKGDPGNLNLGARLQLPAFAVTKPVDTRQPPAPVAAVVEPEKKAEPVSAVTPDPEEVIGRVVVSVGKMQASNRGSFRQLLRNSKVFKGDTLTTASSAYTQIRMKDGALISLRPNTKLVIKEYNFNGKEDGTEKSFMELVMGGFRTITGYIGHKNKSNYRVRTSVATIGIRGTHYGLMVCEAGSCANEETPMEDGVYGGVVDGSIQVDNSSGSYTFNNDQYFHVATGSSPAVELLVPPPVFHGKNETMMGKKSTGDNADQQAQEGQQGGMDKVDGRSAKEQAKGKFKSLTAGMANKKGGARMGSLVMAYVESRPPVLVLPDQVNDAISEAPKVNKAPDGSGLLIALNDRGPAGSTAGIRVGGPAPSEIILGSKQLADGSVINNVPIAVRTVETDPATGAVTKYELLQPSGVGGVRDIGGNPIGVNWGRWDANYKLAVNGAPQATQGPLHYVYSDQITSTAQLANLNGLKVQIYNKIGGTTPTTLSGQAATLNTLSITADFVAAEIQAYDISLSLQDGSLVDMMLDTGAGPVSFDNMRNIQLKDISVGSGTGNASAAFVGSQAEGVITTYSLTDNVSEGVNGAAVLAR